MTATSETNYILEITWDDDSFSRRYSGPDINAALRALNSELMLDRNREPDDPLIEEVQLTKYKEHVGLETILEIVF